MKGSFMKRDEAKCSCASSYGKNNLLYILREEWERMEVMGEMSRPEGLVLRNPSVWKEGYNGEGNISTEGIVNSKRIVYLLILEILWQIFGLYKVYFFQ